MKPVKIDIKDSLNQHIEKRREATAADRAREQAEEDRIRKRQHEIRLIITELTQAVSEALEGQLPGALTWEVTMPEALGYRYELDEPAGSEGFRSLITCKAGLSEIELYQTTIRALYDKAGNMQSLRLRGCGNTYVEGDINAQALQLAIEVYDSYGSDEE